MTTRRLPLLPLWLLVATLCIGIAVIPGAHAAVSEQCSGREGGCSECVSTNDHFDEPCNYCFDSEGGGACYKQGMCGASPAKATAPDQCATGGQKACDYNDCASCMDGIELNCNWCLRDGVCKQAGSESCASGDHSAFDKDSCSEKVAASPCHCEGGMSIDIDDCSQCSAACAQMQVAFVGCDGGDSSGGGGGDIEGGQGGVSGTTGESTMKCPAMFNCGSNRHLRFGYQVIDCGTVATVCSDACCVDDAPEAPTEKQCSVVGRWTGSLGGADATVEYTASGRLLFILPKQPSTVTYKATMTSSIKGYIDIQNLEDDDEACKAMGTYDVTFEKGCASGKFSNAMDQCTGRQSQIMDGAWEPVAGSGSDAETKKKTSIIGMLMGIVFAVLFVAFIVAYFTHEGFRLCVGCLCECVCVTFFGREPQAKQEDAEFQRIDA
jgi:hypothetical protein